MHHFLELVFGAVKSICLLVKRDTITLPLTLHSLYDIHYYILFSHWRRHEVAIVYEFCICLQVLMIVI